MAANQILALGVLAGLAAVAGFLAVSTPFRFIIVPVLAGYHANRLLHRRLNRNWGAFLVSLTAYPSSSAYSRPPGGYTWPCP
jgi:hypothetical protein